MGIVEAQEVESDGGRVAIAVIKVAPKIGVKGKPETFGLGVPLAG